jgi:hypothetical protein
MPYKIKKKNGSYEVSSPHGKKAKKTTKAKAEAQVRLLRAIEHNPEFVPKKKKAAKKRVRDSKASY